MNPWKEVKLPMRGIYEGRVVQYELPALIKLNSLTSIGISQVYSTLELILLKYGPLKNII